MEPGTSGTSAAVDGQQQHSPTDDGDSHLSRVRAEMSDVDRIFAKLSALPIQSQHPDLLTRCRPIIERWYDAFSRSDPALWRRMRRAIPKELNESAFIIKEMIQMCEEECGDDNGGEADRPPYTIVDMCSGVGYLSMFLSHLLPVGGCSRIVAIDILFRLPGKAMQEDEEAASTDVGSKATDSAADKEEKPQSHHRLSSDHLTSPMHPIPIRPRKANIKKGRELRQIAQHCVAKAPGPVIILGVHLCKSLSVHTVRLFNTTNASRLYLKPCCLPGRKDLYRREPPFWTFENMQGGGFGVKTLYCSEVGVQRDDEEEESGKEDVNRALKQMGRDAGEEESRQEQEQEKEQEPPQHAGVRNHALFSRWVGLLRDAADTAEEGVTAKIHYCSVQTRHFQNQYIVATR